MISPEKIQQNFNFSSLQTRKFHVLKYFLNRCSKRSSHSSNVSDSFVCACNNSLESSRIGYYKNTCNENKLKNTDLTDITFVSGKY